MENLTRETFLSRKRIGLILRVFAQKPEQIQDRIKMLEKLVEKVGCRFISRIDILVWNDSHYKSIKDGKVTNAADCGMTFDVLNRSKERLFGSNPGVFVHDVKYGDLYCGLLNYGIANQLRNRIDYSLVLSAEAADYLNAETIEAMIEAVCSGALVTGVAINELTDSILAGRIANIFAMWENISLMHVGGFDLRAAMPLDDKSANYMRGWDMKKGDVFYHLAGVEVIPLARLVELFGPCIAPILPQGKGVKLYQVPTDPDLYLRHISKLETKSVRQAALLAQIDCDPSFLQGGVIEKYRQF